MMMLAATLSQRWLTQGPSTSRSLHSSSRNTLALGSSTGQALDAGGDQPERRAADEDDARGHHHKRGGRYT